jgi:hypothetical protein
MTGPERSDSNPANTLTREFLAWLARCPRTYTEVMEAWQTQCPRLAVWEDAQANGLVRVQAERGVRLGQAVVALTPRGETMLDGRTP